MMYCYFTFPSTYNAVRAETLLKGNRYSFKMVPVPRSISSSCGTALRCLKDEVVPVEEILLKGGVSIDGCHTVEASGFSLTGLLRRNKGGLPPDDK